MLQCNNYKCQRRRTENMAFGAALSPLFYRNPNRCAASGGLWRYVPMGNLASNPRNLLSLAASLRRLAHGSLSRGDQALCLLAAEALEKRAQWLAAPTPEDGRHRHDPELHKPVDMTI